MSEHILSIDPGDTTGYAYAEVSKDKVKILASGVVGYPAGIKRLMDDAAKHRFHVIVIEDFIIRKSLIGERPSALRIIGGFELSTYNFEIVLQQPHEKSRCPDSMLDKLGLSSHSPHIRDAYRHCVIYAQKKHNFRG